MTDSLLAHRFAGPLSMTSFEVAELTGKNHAHVMRDIRAMIERLSADPNLDWHCKSETYLDAQGKERQQYRMDKNTSLTLVSGYDPIPRFRIITRWQALEAERPAPALNPANFSRMQLIELAMQAEQERLALEHRVNEIQPKADALDLISTASEGATNITQSAKALGMGPKALFVWLHAHNWIYRRPGGRGWVAYQRRIQQGLLEHKVTTVHRDDGTEKLVEQVLVTGKGIAKIALLQGCPA